MKTNNPPYWSSRASRHVRLELFLLLLVASLPFLPALSRGLVSEDFIILRRLWEQPFWAMAREQFCGPWMGVRLVLFWRPISTFILQLQELLWGVHPFGFLLVQLGTHLLSAALLFMLTRRLFLDQQWPARCVCLLFAVYPLHPNSVLFIASFATIFATSFGLASLLLFIEWRRLNRGYVLVGSVVAFCLSLGSYEGSFILPGLLVLVDIVWLRERGEALDWKGLWRRHLPFIGLALAYLVLRQFLLGAAIGGYSVSSFQPSSLWVILKRFQLRWSYLLIPKYGWLRPGWLDLASEISVFALALGLMVKPRSRFWRFLLGLLWIIVARLPFGDTKVVPADGRYWYLASAGIGFMVVGLAEFFRSRRVRENFLAAVTILITLSYGICLTSIGQRYREASSLVEKIRAQALMLRDPEYPGSAVFLLGVPQYLKNSKGKNIAQVFAWGLSDALGPPFSDPGIRAFPLGSLQVEDCGPLMARLDLGSVWKWGPHGLSLLQFKPTKLDEIQTTGIEDISRGFRFKAIRGVRYRLVIVGRMQTAITPLPQKEGWESVSLPRATVTSDWHLYGDDLYIWIEGRNSKGQLTSSSRLLVLHPASSGLSR